MGLKTTNENTTIAFVKAPRVFKLSEQVFGDNGRKVVADKTKVTQGLFH